MKKFTKIFIGGLLVLYLWCLFSYLNTPVRTEVVNFGRLEDSENVTGYVIREESILYSNTIGDVNPLVAEGERVSKGANIATIYKGSLDPNIQKNLKIVNERIAEITKNQIKTGLFSSDIQKIDKSIDSKVDKIVQISYDEKMEQLIEIKEDINALLEKKSVISGEKGPSGYNLQALRQEKNKYEEQLRSAVANIYSDTAGIISYNIDGMEQILNPKNISKFMPQDFQNLDNIQIEKSENLESQQAVAKVINNFEWYIGFVIDSKKVSSLKAGDFVQVRFNDLGDKILDANVYYISQEDKGKLVVVLLLNEHIEYLYTMRKVNIDLIKNSYSGFKIPVSSIRVKDGKTGVYIVKNQIARFREIEILHKNNDFAIVKENNLNNKGLLLYDEIIIKSNNIEDGTLIR